MLPPIKMGRLYSNQQAAYLARLLQVSPMETTVSRPSDGTPNQAVAGAFLAVVRRKERGYSCSSNDFNARHHRPISSALIHFPIPMRREMIYCRLPGIGHRAGNYAKAFFRYGVHTFAKTWLSHAHTSCALCRKTGMIPT
jgi:hypothetical protein